MSVSDLHQDYCDLDRQFVDLATANNIEEAAARSYLARMSGAGGGWGWLLGDRRIIVVLGEAGSGKTRELRERVKLLRSQGATAFFVPVERLADRSLLDAIDSRDRELFSAWIEGGSTDGYLCLDSVDEARLVTRAAFSNALHNLTEGLNAQVYRRIRLVISCRVSEWRGQADVAEVVERLEPGESSSAAEPLLRVVELMPLDWSRITRLAQHLSATQSAAFLQAVQSASAEDFARRPKDVIDLFNHWAGKGRLGKLRELVEYDVTSKLSESEERKSTDDMALERLLSGAKQLAAGVVLCRRGSFALPDATFDPISAPNTLGAQATLGDGWAPAEVSKLFNRPMFDEACYGRVRFHHRTTVEFLCAQWLQDRKRAGCSAKTLRDLLFTNAHGHQVLRKGVAPAAAWLVLDGAPWSVRIRREIIRVAPQELLRHGDPASLPIEDRRTALAEIVKRSKGKRRLWLSIDAQQLKRVADPGLDADIARWIGDASNATELRALLLDTARLGQLTGCATAALAIAKDASSDTFLRADAIEAVAELGSAAALKDLCAVLLADQALSLRLIGIAVRTLYPRALSTSDLVRLAAKAPPIGRYSSDQLPHLLKRVAKDQVPQSDVLPFLQKMLELIETPLETSSSVNDQQGRFLWLRPAITALAKRLLDARSITESELHVLSRVMLRLRAMRKIDPTNNDAKKSLHTSTLKHPAVRRFYAWRRYDAVGRPPNVPWLFDHYDVIDYVADDLRWLLEDTKALEEPQARIALKWACDVYMRAKPGSRHLRDIHAAARRSPNLAALVRQHTATPFQIRWYRLKASLREYMDFGWRAHWEKSCTIYYRLYNKVYFHRKIRALAAGDFSLVQFLVSEARIDDDHYAQEADSARIRAKYGRRIEGAMREGTKLAWRRYEPPLPTHNAPIQNGLTVGFSGIRFSLEDGWSFADANADEARLAARYAFRELNRFPPWIEDLFKNHPAALLEIATQCLDYDWSVDDGVAYHSSAIHKAGQASSAIADAIALEVLRKLETGDPKNVSVLEAALDIIIERLPAQVETLCATRATSPLGAQERQVLWLRARTRVNPEAGIIALEMALAGLSADAAEDLAVRFAGAYSGWRENHPGKPAGTWSATALSRCYLLLTKYLTKKNELHRFGNGESGVYSPTSRDGAQRFRDLLPELIVASGDSNAYTVLKELIGVPAVTDQSEYLEHALETRLQLEAEVAAWSESSVARFAVEHESDPITSSELFAITCSRLEDLKSEVETDDYSRRNELPPKPNEFDLQIWVARYLRDNARARYSEVREAEVDNEKEPDIRVLRPGLGASTIEVKWADSWSYKQLANALSMQLVGQYLKAHSSRHGILLVGYRGEKGAWEGPAGNLTFKELIAQLEADSKMIVQDRPELDALRVVTVDFSPPTKS